jgi:hypothetical protein
MANPNPTASWSKGQSGNPNGRPKGVSLNELLLEALEGEHRTYKVDPKTKKKKLVKTKYAILVVKRLLDKAISDGDMKALKEIFDRVEGKSVQPISGPDGGPLEHMVIDASTQEAILKMQSRFLKVKAEADSKYHATRGQPSGNQTATKPNMVAKKKKIIIKKKSKK